ncbi:tetratricopeptide repeat protein [Egbenema bharatensis]|uniref:tetratricopeptide repeat protein n=1 Tax=Egbenema bharatensis TaxID=3463334 RepID=UPI003A87EEFE
MSKFSSQPDFDIAVQSDTRQPDTVGETHLENSDHPKDSAFWYSQGDSLARENRYEEALACFDRAIELQPDYHEAWVFRGVILIHLERYQEALESCDRATEICPTNSEAWIFRGAALHQLGNYRTAYASYEQALGDRTAPVVDEFWSWVKRAWSDLL